MKISFFPRCLAGFLLLAVMAGCEEKPPKISYNFVCEASKKDGTPTTYGITPTEKKPIIRWKSEYFAGSGFTPQKRCETVSKKMQTAANNGILNFITSGRENNQDVICFSSAKGGKCNLTFFTLKPNQSASKVLEDVFNIDRAGGPIEQSSTSFDIDFYKWVELIPTEK
jgi:hypothetical protein